MSLYSERTIVTEPRAIYATFDRQAEGKVLSTTWFLTNEAPYIRGNGVRLRIGRFALTIGICKRTKPFSRAVPIIYEKFEWGWDSGEEDPTDGAPPEPAREDDGSKGDPFALPA